MRDLELTDPYEPEPGPEPAPPRDPPPRPRLVGLEGSFPAPASGHSIARVPARPTSPAGEDVPASAPGAAGARTAPGAWKAAASSVPRLREKPVPPLEETAGDAFPGFAQDERSGQSLRRVAEHPAGPLDGPPGGHPPAGRSPLAVEPPFWEIWLERILAIPRPVLFGSIVGLLIVVGGLLVFRPGEEPHVPLARLRQQPEAFDGRLVTVRGKAGEAFAIGGSYVFNLRQGRDTIVVYSRSRPPAPNRDVRTTGTVMIGYLDGLPRVALVETPAAP